MLVEPTDVAADDALAQRADPPADELRKIGMVESSDRHAAAPCDHPSTPGRVKGISSLDEVGLEGVQGAIPRARIERQAIVERARYRQGRQRRHRSAVHFGARSGYDDRMLPRGVRAQPGVLRRQVAFDPAAGGRIEQSRVDQMHALIRLTIPCVPASSGPALHILGRSAVKRASLLGVVLHNRGGVRKPGRGVGRRRARKRASALPETRARRSVPRRSPVSPGARRSRPRRSCAGPPVVRIPTAR